MDPDNRSHGSGPDFERFVADQRPALRRFATVLTGQTWLADDLVADVLGRAFERWDRIGPMAEPVAYVRRMIVNEHLSWHRRLRRTRPHDELPEDSWTDTTVSDGADERAERDAMISRLARLPRRQRAAVVCRYYSGMSTAQIADVLGCREGTVRSQLSRALATLRLELQDTVDVHETTTTAPAQRPASSARPHARTTCSVETR